MPRYIDADALVRKICGMTCGCERDECGDHDDAACPTVALIETAPTVSPDEVRGVGKWINKTMSVPNGHGQTYNRWGCSVCKAKFKLRTKYCPNCGARLTGGEND